MKTPPEEGSQGSLTNSISINTSLQRASRILSSMLVRKASFVNKPKHLIVLSYTDGFKMDDPNTTQFNGDDDCYIIRIEPINPCSLNDADLDTKLAFMASNFGISNLCLASTASTSRPSVAHRLRVHAHDCLVFSHDTVASMSEQERFNDVELAQLCFAVSLTLFNATQSLMDLGFSSEAEDCLSRIILDVEEYTQMEKCLLGFGIVNCAACA